MNPTTTFELTQQPPFRTKISQLCFQMTLNSGWKWVSCNPQLTNVIGYRVVSITLDGDNLPFNANNLRWALLCQDLACSDTSFYNEGGLSNQICFTFDPRFADQQNYGLVSSSFKQIQLKTLDVLKFNITTINFNPVTAVGTNINITLEFLQKIE